MYNKSCDGGALGHKSSKRWNMTHFILFCFHSVAHKVYYYWTMYNLHFFLKKMFVHRGSNSTIGGTLSNIFKICERNIIKCKKKTIFIQLKTITLFIFHWQTSICAPSQNQNQSRNTKNVNSPFWHYSSASCFKCPLDGAIIHETFGLSCRCKSSLLVNVKQKSFDMKLLPPLPVSNVWILDYLQ